MNQINKKRTIVTSLKLTIVMVCMLFVGQVFAQQIVEPEMVFVGSGSFTMGCSEVQVGDCNSDEKPSHVVELSGFTISKYEVTQALWKSLMGTNPSRFKGDSLPVESVSWDEVQVFIKRLNEETGKNYRLPTEAEWEYAARGGKKSQLNLYAGAMELEKIAWCNTNSNNTIHNVGTKEPNELGIYDMSGNVWEWCSDLYGAYDIASNQTNPTGATKGTSRVLRGGCYAAIAKQCRVSCRKALYQGGKDNMTGFRLAMDDDREERAAAAAAKAEQERIAAEKAAEEARIAAEKAAAEAAKKAELERIAAEKAAEEARIAAEKAAEKKARQEEHARKMQLRKDSIAALPWNTFYTVNAACSAIPDLSYGFKVGQVKVAGWYFSAMTNFHFKGAFTPFEENRYVLTDNQKVAKMSAMVGLVIRPCKPLSLHIGAGFGYRALAMETNNGWFNYPKRTYYGVDAAFGFMFHIKGFVLSAEAVYNTYDFNKSEVSELGRLEGKVGIGFCLPNKKSNKN